MILYLAQSVFIITLFYLSYSLVLKRFTFFNSNRFFLLFGIFMALLLPFLPLNFSEPQTEYVYMPANWQSIIENEPIQEPVTGVTISTWWEGLTWQQILFGIYWIGFSIFALNFIFQIARVVWLMRTGNSEFKEGVQFIFTQKQVSPFSFFSNIVINPDSVQKEQWKEVVIHEKVHISQWHQLDVVFAEILKIYLWFLPISWWYGKQIRANLEYIADDISIKNGLNRKHYQLSLVSISQQTPGPELVNSFSKKIVKNRIQMLNKMKTNQNRWAVYGLLFPALLAGTLFISTTVQAQEKKVKKVIVIGEDGTVEEDVKVLLKDENGEYQEVENEVEVIIPSKGLNSESKTVKKWTDEDGTVREEIIVVRNDSDTIMHDINEEIRIDIDSLKDHVIKKIKVGKNTIIIDSLGMPGAKTFSFRSSPNTFYEYHFDSEDFDFDFDDMDLDIHIEELEGMDLPKGLFKSNGNRFFFFDDDGDLNISEEEYNKLSKKQRRQLDKIKKELEKNREENKKEMFFFPRSKVKTQTYGLFNDSSDPSKSPLVIIDGKESKRSKIAEIGDDNIESMNVIKGNAAIKTYGEKGKNGVIVIKTKKKKGKRI